MIGYEAFCGQHPQKKKSHVANMYYTNTHMIFPHASSLKKGVQTAQKPGVPVIIVGIFVSYVT